MMDDNDSTTVRHSISRDAVSLLDTDIIDDTTEDKAESEVILIEILTFLKRPTEKILVLSLLYGLAKNDIATILNVHPSAITRLHDIVKTKVREFYHMAKDNDPLPDVLPMPNTSKDNKIERQRKIIVNFFEVVYGRKAQ